MITVNYQNQINPSLDFELFEIGEGWFSRWKLTRQAKLISIIWLSTLYMKISYIHASFFLEQ